MIGVCRCHRWCSSDTAADHTYTDVRRVSYAQEGRGKLFAG